MKILLTSVIRSRCPCCGRGRLFRGWLAFRPACDACGLVYEQWVGDWTSATWIAHSAGFLAAFAVFVWMFTTGTGMNGPVPPEFSVASLAVLLSLLFLRPSKALWIGIMYWAGGIEVSARTRAWLLWFAARDLAAAPAPLKSVPESSDLEGITHHPGRRASRAGHAGRPGKEDDVKTLVKVIVFIALLVAAVEFTTKGEGRAFGGILVKMGIVKSADAPTLKDRVEGSLDKARNDEARRYGTVDEIAREGN